MLMMEQNQEMFAKNANHLIAPIEAKDVKERYVGSDDEFDFFVTDEEVSYGIKDELAGDFSPNALVRELIFVVGIYAPGEIETIINNANSKALIIIIEPRLSFLLHAMERKDLSFLANPNVILIAQKLEALPQIIDQLFTSPALFLTGNLRFYSTYFYRVYDLAMYGEVFKVVSTILKYKMFTIGNAIEDSLVGVEQNVYNARHFLAKSKDVAKLRNAFRGVPAIIVAAGPSIEKNIQLLKEAKGKALIIAADTITAKLRKEGIVPDFMCTIERDKSIYDFFYKDKAIPKEVTLVAPPVISPQVIENFEGNLILPMRSRVREYFWLQEVLDLNNDNVVSMGSSCAHVAFGLATHFGASPIVLVGQDLAYAEDGERTHSLGTVYDEQNINPFDVPKVEVDGYNGGKVLSNEYWIAFRNWIELEIMEKRVRVINATEGGSKIENTEQQTLRAVLDEFCQERVDVAEVLANTSNYNLDDGKIEAAFRLEVIKLKEIAKLARAQEKRLQKLSITEDMSPQAMLKCMDTFRKGDTLLPAVYGHQLLMHSMQGELLHMLMRFYAIKEELTYTSLQENFVIQKNFSYVIYTVVDKIIDILKPETSAGKGPVVQ